MPVRQILILTESPFSKRDYDRFGVGLLSQSFDVSILDCTPWLKRGFWDTYSNIAYRCPGYQVVEDYDSLRSHMERVENAVAIDYLGDSSDANRIRNALKRMGIPRALIFHALLPTEREGVLRRARRKARQLLRPGPAPDLVVLSGETSLVDPRVRNARRIWAHSLDYDIYLRDRCSSSPPSEPYAVFLDEDMIYHSDYHHLGTSSPTTAEEYYPAMKSFFQRVQREAAMSVKVALHPRSDFALQRELWSGFETVPAMTSQLVRDSSLVLCHLSTSLAFAVLWRKPLIFLTTNDLENSYMGGGIALRSRLLQSPLLNVETDLNESFDAGRISEVNEKAYAQYVADYIKKSGTRDLPVWQLFSDFIRDGALDNTASI